METAIEQLWDEAPLQLSVVFAFLPLTVTGPAEPTAAGATV